MKWSNKGHQFDTLGKVFENRKIYLYGAGGDYSAPYLAYLEKCGLGEMVDGFIDHNYRNMPDGYLGKPVYSPDKLFLEHDRNHIIIVALREPLKTQIMDRLVRAGYPENAECFTWDRFVHNLNDIILPVYAMYAQERLILSSACIIPSTVCNLKCRDCLNFTPYIKQFEIRELEEVCRDVDLLFTWVDYTFKFQISGGEPLLYKRFADLVEYIGVHYRNKIDVFETVLNGTVVPSDEVCTVMKKYQMTVVLDDYRANIASQIDRRAEIIKQIEKHDLLWVDNKVEEWFDLDILHTDNSGQSEEDLAEYFDICNNPWHCYEKGKMYACNFDRFASKAGLNEDVPEASFDFREMTKEKKKELLEFTLNYNEKGYVPLCKKCAGWADMNKNRVPVAVQVE